MKKKAIEKIPYLTLPKVSKKKDVKYIGVTAFKNVAHERHLFLEVYRNSRDTMDVPLVRIVLTKKDFGNYFPEKAEWTRQKIETDHYYNQGLLWSELEDRSISWGQAVKRNILMSEDDFNRIKAVCNVEVWNESKWWKYIYKHEDNIVIGARRKAEERRYERRQQALKDRMDNTPKLPEKMILDRADRIYLNRKHFLYYKKHGCWTDITCSKCGGVSHGRWKKGISYEAQFQKWVEEPRKGQRGHCPMCGEAGEYKCQGTVNGKYSEKIHLFLGQKYKETGFVMRYIEVAKEWQLELIAGEKGVEMSGAYEQLSGVEIARAYYMPDAKTQIDYQKYNPHTGKDFWDDCNISGIANITIDEGKVLPETYENMKGTMFQYSAMQEYAQEVPCFDAIDYLNHYKATPQIEMLVKMGLTGVVKELNKCGYGLVKNIDAKRPDLFLGIRKQRVRQLIEKKGDPGVLMAMQMEYGMKAEWTDEQMEHIVEAGLSRAEIERALRFMSMQQLLNRIKKYAVCEWGTGCETAARRLRDTATTYLDYLNMRLALGYNLNNTVYQQPRNLRIAHDRMVAESNKKQVEKRLLEVEMRFPNIRRNYRKLRNRYFYEDDQMLIRPARSAEEIVMEGRILHHCVGGDNYLEKHNDGRSYILMLRQQSDPETPYITVEIDAKKDSIIQWYGAHNRKPDETNMKKWLNEYIALLKAGLLKAEQMRNQEIGQQLLLPAM